MSRIDPQLVVHRLNVNPTLRLVKQKKRNFASERNQVIVEEVEKLLVARFIREVHCLDWLANIIMVWKPNEKWRMCANFTNLNKECPKDSFSFSMIDTLVDTTTGH